MSEQIYATGKKNIVVTGAAGFIGTNLCERLVRDNNIIAIDNFITGKESNIDRLLQNPNFEFIRHDISEPIDLNSFPELRQFQIDIQGVQEIYHLACPTSPRDHSKLALAILDATSVGTQNTLELAKKHDSVFVHISSQHVYGSFKSNDPIKENDFGYSNPIGPRSAYDEGKRFSETLVDYYHRQYKLKTRIARVFTTYGPKMAINDGRSVPDFIYNAIKGNDLVIYGDEKTTNTFCYIDDVVDALVKMALSDTSEPINIGQFTRYTLKDLAETIVRLADSNSNIIYQKPEWQTTSYNIPDITKAKEKIGWFPLITIEDGLAKTIEHIKANLRLYQV